MIDARQQQGVGGAQGEVPWGYPRTVDAWLCCLVAGRTTWHKLPAAGELIIGSDASADLRVEALGVAGRHVVVRCFPMQAVVEDLGSGLSTKLNGLRLEEPTVLRQGDWILIGTALIGLRVLLPTWVGTRRLFDRDDFLVRTQEEQDRCERYGRTAAVVSIVFDPPPAPGEEASQIFEFFRRQVRRMDVVAMLGGATFGVLLPEVGREGALVWVRRLEKAARDQGRSVSVDIVIHPVDKRGATSAAEGGPGEAASLPAPAARLAVSSRAVVLESEVMRQVYALVDRAAASCISVLLLGETGVGKEVIASAIHSRSARSARPLVSVNCAALPDSLIEGELFGVERGAFTGSDRPRAGLIEQAAGGTLLLDEVGDIPPALQPKLLRAIQDKCIRRLGSTVSRPVDFRLVAATNRNLESMVAEGTFREDLYYRLSAFTIAIPPLRNRRDDIPGLVMVALREAAAVMQRPVPEVSETVMEKLRSHPWPGNVRQLFNVVERALVLEDSLMLHEQAFPQLFDLAAPPSAPPTPRTSTPRPSAVGAEVPLPQAPSVTFSPSEPPSSVRFDSAVMEMERRLLLDALERCDGNQTRAAELLAMPRRTFVYKLKRHGIRRGANHE